MYHSCEEYYNCINSFQKFKTTQITLKRLCPKEDKRLPMLPLTFSIFQQDESINKIPPNCPGYLIGQDLVFGHLYSARRYHVNGQVVHGSYTVKLFEYIAKKLKFKPSYRIGRPIYFAHNDTWKGFPKWVSK